MELDSRKQLRRFLDGHIKHINTANIPVPMQIKRLKVSECIQKVANKQLRTSILCTSYNPFESGLLKTHNVRKTEDNTAIKFFELYNELFT